MMKSRKPLLTALASGALMFVGALIAQDVPPATPPASAASTPMPPSTSMPPAAPMPPSEPTPPAEPMPAAPAPSSSAAPMPAPMPSGTPMPTTAPAASGTAAAPAAPTGNQGGSPASQGQVVVRSVPPPAPQIGPAPPFEQLSGGSKSITAEQAVAYPPLANDFINADRNRNGKISKKEYENWTKQL